MSKTIGRNEPCPCGSGRKYKQCCQGKGGPAASAGSKATMIVIGAILFLGAVILTISLVAGGGGSACPPGQVFDASHGHCH